MGGISLCDMIMFVLATPVQVNGTPPSLRMHDVSISTPFNSFRTPKSLPILNSSKHVPKKAFQL